MSLTKEVGSGNTTDPYQLEHPERPLFSTTETESALSSPMMAHQKSSLLHSLSYSTICALRYRELHKYLKNEHLSESVPSRVEQILLETRFRKNMNFFLLSPLPEREPIDGFFTRITLARELIRRRNFHGTTDKLVNALSGFILLGITRMELYREAALHAPEKSPGERLERWRNPEERATNFNIDAPPKGEKRQQSEIEDKHIRLRNLEHPFLKDSTITLSIAFTIGNRPKMEDALAAGSVTIYDKEIPFYGLFDGHRGSSTAIFLKQNTQQILQEDLSLLGKPLDQADTTEIENVLSVIALRAEQMQREHPETRASGATFILAVIINNAVWAVNAGDSRILALRGDETFQLTEDATPTSPHFIKGILKRQGTISDNRVSGQLAVARVVGDKDITGITARAKVTRFPLSLGVKTTLIIGCDGLFEATSSSEIAQEYRKNPTAASLLQKAYRDGSDDNISVMIVQI